MKLRTLKQLKNAKDKRVLLRVDFNVPIDKTGVTDDTRIRECLPTIKYLLKKKTKLIIITHLGRPEGKVVDRLKLDAVYDRLRKILKMRPPHINKVHTCLGKSVENAIAKMKGGDVLMLENIRFHPEEELCEKNFTSSLAKLGEAFVNDAFAACHRKHSSTAGIAKYLPSYAGFLVEKEIKGLTPLLKSKKKNLTVIVGGAKIDTKIGLIKNFLKKAKYILIGGGLANTFLAAEGFDVGKSFYEPAKTETAQNILMAASKTKTKIILPGDVIVADVVTAYAGRMDIPIKDVEGDMKILDIGSLTREKFVSIIKKSKIIVWNGPLGVYEFTPFASGTKQIAKAIAAMKNKAKTYIGGGDTIDAMARLKISRKNFTHVSTGGGAMLEFLENKELPGIKVLMN